MFADTLLDSSPAREPVLTRMHHALAIGAGVIGFLAGFMAFSPLFPSEATKLRVAVAGAAGIVLMIHTLMVCYVYADARRLGFGKWRWFLPAVFFSVIGFLAYLGFSAAKNGRLAPRGAAPGVHRARRFDYSANRGSTLSYRRPARIDDLA